MSLRRLLIVVFVFGTWFVQAHADEMPRKEYPRPQFERESWLNLNGEWDYTFDFTDIGMQKGFYKATAFSGKITVPFCPEGRLSGVEHKDFVNHISGITGLYRGLKHRADGQNCMRKGFVLFVAMFSLKNM